MKWVHPGREHYASLQWNFVGGTTRAAGNTPAQPQDLPVKDLTTGMHKCDIPIKGRLESNGQDSNQSEI
jgi:hypothetical protein